MPTLKMFFIFACCCMFLQSCIPIPVRSRVTESKEARFTLRSTMLNKKLQQRSQRDDILLEFGRPQQVDSEQRHFYYLTLQVACKQVEYFLPGLSVTGRSSDDFYFDYITRLQFNEAWEFIGYQRFRVKRLQAPDAANPDNPSNPVSDVDEDYYVELKQHCIPKHFNYEKQAQ